MLTDAQWVVLEPLVEACRPHAKVPPRHLRRTIGAILWRHDNGAKRRALPAEHGPWWMAAQIFIRWALLGVWERLLALVQEPGLRLGMTFLDGTNILIPGGSCSSALICSACPSPVAFGSLKEPTSHPSLPERAQLVAFQAAVG